MIRIAISGFGRIGRTFLRTILADKQALEKLAVVAINIGPAKKETIAHMFKYDTIMGTYNGTVSLVGDQLRIDDMNIAIVAESDPSRIDWHALAIDWVVECSGHFTKREGAMKHIASGARKVLISAPAQGEDVTIVPGVNNAQYDKNKHQIVSLGSCTTNAFVTMLKVLHDEFVIDRGLMTTVHAYTNTQVLLDVEGEDLRRSRAAALNIIPTTTGAMKVIGKIIPDLDGRIEAAALRVPVADVSLVDFSFISKKPVTIDAINQLFKRVSNASMRGIIDITMEPLVSSDFTGNPHSVIIDGQLTAVNGQNMGKVFGWYDNEWGYSCRLKDFLVMIS
jgi:glyceraldehyde 3-phosphate dehydrogenase